jgi:nucleotide-binding universal stress UspA family protein
MEDNMNSIQRILFPVDLSEDNEILIPNVLAMVDKFNAELHVIFVVKILPYISDIFVTGADIKEYEELEARVIAGSRKKMDELINTHFGRLSNVQSEVVKGDPYDTILKYVSDNKIDMVVMGTRGRKGFGRVIFGSVAERVIKWAHVPVLVVNPAPPEK